MIRNESIIFLDNISVSCRLNISFHWLITGGTARHRNKNDPTTINRETFTSKKKWISFFLDECYSIHSEKRLTLNNLLMNLCPSFDVYVRANPSNYPHLTSPWNFEYSNKLINKEKKKLRFFFDVIKHAFGFNRSTLAVHWLLLLGGRVTESLEGPSPF